MNRCIVERGVARMVSSAINDAGLRGIDFSVKFSDDQVHVGINVGDLFYQIVICRQNVIRALIQKDNACEMQEALRRWIMECAGAYDLNKLNTMVIDGGA